MSEPFTNEGFSTREDALGLLEAREARSRAPIDILGRPEATAAVRELTKASAFLFIKFLADDVEDMFVVGQRG